MPNINLLHDSSSFSETEVNATTVGQLRTEKGLAGYTINVDRTVVTDEHALEDGMFVAAVKSNKTGG